MRYKSPLFSQNYHRKEFSMSPYPSFIQSIPHPLRRLRVLKLWLLAHYMAGVEKGVSEQIRSIDEQIGRFEEQMRLMEEFRKVENKEDGDLGDLGVSDATDDNRFEHVISAQTAQGGAIYDKHRKKETQKRKHKKLSLVAAPPSKIPAARRILFNQQPPLRAPFQACKIAKTANEMAAMGTSRDREIASSSKHLESKLLASTYAAGSKIGTVNFLRQPGQDQLYIKGLFDQAEAR